MDVTEIEDFGGIRLGDRDGQPHILVAHCSGCKRVTLDPRSEECECGEEFYPVHRWVPLRKALTIQDMKGA